MAWALLFFLGFILLAYHRVVLIGWTLIFSLLLLAYSYFQLDSLSARIFLWVMFITVTVVLNVRPIRRRLFSQYALAIYKKVMPKLSATEREALVAGTIGWEGDLFAGKPDWRKLLAMPTAALTPEEQAFLDGPVEELCTLIDDWDITHQRYDLPPMVWQFLKDQGFFGLIIPKAYGGKQFSAVAHAAILLKLHGRSITVASTVAVPNSLGPAELLLHYGTVEQKDYYLPRLAKGLEIPCFALTSPEAGSDASAMPDTGIICKGRFDDKEIIGIRLNWDKRYITLAPIATVLGLAFKAFDPECLLSDKVERGITCALIPVTTPGIHIGQRHLPLNIPFQNGPTQGHDVFIPLDWVIGGEKMIGQGWHMLMECLVVGRAISLPSGAVAGAKGATLVTSAYARIRRQFKQPIGNFEGVAELLARMGGYTYMISAGMTMTLAAINNGEKPAVASAILKYHSTERSRKVILDAMDIHGGKGICLGPRNYLGRSYQGIPIGITVEGANVLTRNMIIFGQGAVRCHPYALAELTAAQDADYQRSLILFDKALFAHIGFTISNVVRSLVLGLTSGYLVITPKGLAKRYYQQFTRFSAAFAFIADFCMLSLGGKLKRKEKISARLGDVLSLLYFGSAMLKQFKEQGEPKDDKPLLDWACRDILFTIQQQLAALLQNFPNKLLAALLQMIIFPLGKWLTGPTDALDKQVAKLLLTPNAARSRLTAGIFTTPIANNWLAKMEQALPKIIACEAIEKRLQEAMRSKQIKKGPLAQRAAEAVVLKIISNDEQALLLEAEALRKEIIAVDHFSRDELTQTKN